MTDDLTRIVRYLADTSKAVAEIDKLTKASNKAGAEVEGIGKKLDSFTSFLKKAGAFLLVEESIRGVIGGVHKLIEEFDELGKTAQGIGLTTEQLSALQYAADLAGVGSEQLTKALVSLDDKIAHVSKGTDTASKALRSFGVTTKDDAASALDKIADAFSKMEDGPQKSAIAVSLFGKAAAKMIPLLNGGAAGIKEMTEEAARFGQVITGKVTRQAEAFNDNLARMQRTAKSVGIQLTAGMLPALSALSESFVDSATTGDGFIDTGASIGEMLLNLYGFALKASATIQGFGKVLGAVAAAVVNPTKAGTIFGELIDDVNELEKQANKKLEKLTADFEKFKKSAVPEKKKGAKPAAEIFEDAPVKKAAEAFKLADEPLKKFLDNLERAGELNVDEKLAGIAERLEFLAGQGPGATDAIKALTDAYKKLKAEKDPAAAVALDIENQEKTIALANKYNTALTEMVLNEQISAEAAKTLWKTTGQGATVALTETEKLNNSITGSLQAATSDWATSLVDGFEAADESFSKFIENALKGIAKLIIQKQVLAAFDSFFGTGTGGAKKAAQGAAFTSGGVEYMARGGILNSPTFFTTARGPAVAGEAGPEAVVPLRRSSGGDLGVAASPVTINVQNYTEATVSQRTTDNADGSRVVDMLIERKVRALMSDGSMDRTMRSSYGVSRQPG